MRTALSKTVDTKNQIVNDNRGRQNPANKKSQEMAKRVISHIKKYKPISHYRWAHAPDRLYISPMHKVSSMQKDFIVCYPDDCFSYCYYQNKVKNLNNSFVKLGGRVWGLRITYISVERGAYVKWDRALTTNRWEKK